jgi:hypothetical protein
MRRPSGSAPEGLHAGGHVRGALGLAAVGGDEVQLRLVVLAPLLLTPGDEGDAVAARLKAGCASFWPGLGERARRRAARAEQPQAARAGVVLHRAARDRRHGARAVGA